jgi:hypothetical protein
MLRLNLKLKPKLKPRPKPKPKPKPKLIVLGKKKCSVRVWKTLIQLTCKNSSKKLENL